METFKPIISITHNDLDGLGCQLVLKWVHQDVHYHSTSYNTLLNTLIELEDLLKYDRSKTLIVISDLSVKDDEAKVLKRIVTDNPEVKFIYADHHLRTTEMTIFLKKLPKNFIDLYNTKMCSASILYYYYNIQMPKLKENIDKINAYDMWLTESRFFKDGLVLNEIYESLGHNNFFNSISNYGNLTETITRKINKTNTKIENFINQIDSNSFIYYDDLIVVAQIDKYKSILQYYLSRPISIIISSNFNFSIRLSNELKDIEVEKYTQLFFNTLKKII